MKIVRGKKALVTGAASGLGRAIALALAREGADVCLLDIDEPNLRATAGAVTECGVAVRTEICDLAQPAAITATVNALLAAWGRLDILVNNAGVAYYGPTLAMGAADWERVLAVNLLAPVQLTRELLPTLLAQEEAHILNVCSIFGLVGTRKLAAYQTTKFGLVGLSTSLRAEYGRGGFGVTALCPGFIRTAMVESYATAKPDQARHQLPSFMVADAERVAAKAIRAIRRNRGLVVISPLAQLWWRLTRLSPALVDYLTREGWRGRKPISRHDP